MGDLLAAQGVLLAALTALVATWDQTLESARGESPRTDWYPDNAAAHKRVQRILYRRALPLTLYASLSFLILLPVGWHILNSAMQAWWGGVWQEFDPIGASLVLVTIGVAFLAAYLWAATCGIWDAARTFAKLERDQRSDHPPPGQPTPPSHSDS